MAQRKLFTHYADHGGWHSFSTNSYSRVTHVAQGNQTIGFLAISCPRIGGVRKTFVVLKDIWTFTLCLRFKSYVCWLFTRDFSSTFLIFCIVIWPKSVCTSELPLSRCTENLSDYSFEKNFVFWWPGPRIFENSYKHYSYSCQSESYIFASIAKFLVLLTVFWKSQIGFLAPSVENGLTL